MIEQHFVHIFDKNRIKSAWWKKTKGCDIYLSSETHFFFSKDRTLKIGLRPKRSNQTSISIQSAMYVYTYKL